MRGSGSGSARSAVDAAKRTASENASEGWEMQYARAVSFFYAYSVQIGITRGSRRAGRNGRFWSTGGDLRTPVHANALFPFALSHFPSLLFSPALFCRAFYVHLLATHRDGARARFLRALAPFFSPAPPPCPSPLHRLRAPAARPARPAAAPVWLDALPRRARKTSVVWIASCAAPCRSDAMAGLRRAAALVVALVALGSLASAELVVREVHTDVRAGPWAAQRFCVAYRERYGCKTPSDQAIGRIAIRRRAA